MTLLGASAWTNASSSGTIALAGTSDAAIEVDASAGSAAAGRVIRWNDITISGSTFSVKAELGSSGSSFVVPQCVALIEYDVPTQTVAPEITSHPAGSNIAMGDTRTLSVSATGTGLAYQWFEGLTGDTSNPVPGATANSFTTPALSATTSYWVRVSNAGGSRQSHAASLVLAAAAGSPLQAWATAAGLSGAGATAGAAPHGDGVANLVKFALGLPGNAPANPSALPAVLAQSGASGFAFEFHRATGEVRYVVESSTTLAPGSWTTEAVIERNADPSSVGHDVAVEVPKGSAPKKFLRLRVEE